MKIVNLGSTLRIFPDDLKVEDKIPTGTYDVNFNPMSGYSLTKRSNFETTEKVYGEHDMLADKMVNRYEHSTKNFGVILGGRKGTGKSLTARLVSEKLLAKLYVLRYHHLMRCRELSEIEDDLEARTFEDYSTLKRLLKDMGYSLTSESQKGESSITIEVWHKQ